MDEWVDSSVGSWASDEELNLGASFDAAVAELFVRKRCFYNLKFLCNQARGTANVDRGGGDGGGRKGVGRPGFSSAGPPTRLIVAKL